MEQCDKIDDLPYNFIKMLCNIRRPICRLLNNGWHWPCNNKLLLFTSKRDAASIFFTRSYVYAIANLLNVKSVVMACLLSHKAVL